MVTLIKQCRDRLPKTFILNWSDRLLRKLRLNDELRLVFVGAHEARRVNRRFRKRYYVPDVLTFDNGEPGVLGELMICPEKIKNQANKRKIPLQHEYALMITHGVLHLIGYDHERSQVEAEEMERVQNNLFSTLMVSIQKG